MTINAERHFVHRLMYRVFQGQLYAGLELDHLCNNKSCVNPGHLEQVMPSVNKMRAVASPATINAMKDACVNGHEFTPKNTYVTTRGYRQCRRCKADRENARRKASLQAQQASPTPTVE